MSFLFAALLIGLIVAEDPSILGRPSTNRVTITSTVTRTTTSNSTSTTFLAACGLGGAFQCNPVGLTVGSGTPVTRDLQMRTFDFDVSPGSCDCSGSILVVSLLDSGNSSTSISAVYLDGSLQTVTNPPTTDTALASNQVFLVPSGTTTTSRANGEIEFSSAIQQTTYTVGLTGQVVVTFGIGTTPISGSIHTLKIVSTTGATSVVSVVAGKTS